MSVRRAPTHRWPSLRRAFMWIVPTDSLQMTEDPVDHRRRLDHRHQAHLDWFEVGTLRTQQRIHLGVESRVVHW
jgi:hypothetical protein